MALDKAILHGKEYRKPYYRSGRYDKSCRPHGGCPWCTGNRLHSTHVRVEAAEQQVNDWRYDKTEECLTMQEAYDECLNPWTI